MANILGCVRGLNSCNLQNEVRNFIHTHNIRLFSLFKTRVKSHNLVKLYSIICPNWCFSHNLACHDNGKIVIGWCPNAFNLNITYVNSQYIHCVVQTSVGLLFRCTCYYGFNDNTSMKSFGKA